MAFRILVMAAITLLAIRFLISSQGNDIDHFTFFCIFACSKVSYGISFFSLLLMSCSFMHAC